MTWLDNSHLTSCWLWTGMLQLLADRTKNVQDVHHQTAPCFLGCIYSSSVPRFYFLRFQSACKLYKHYSKRNMEEENANPSAGGRSAFSHTNDKGPKEKQKQAQIVHKCPHGAATWRFCNVALGSELTMVSPRRAGFVELLTKRFSLVIVHNVSAKYILDGNCFPLVLCSLVFRQEVDVILKFA